MLFFSLYTEITLFLCDIERGFASLLKRKERVVLETIEFFSLEKTNVQRISFLKRGTEGVTQRERETEREMQVRNKGSRGYLKMKLCQ